MLLACPGIIQRLKEMPVRRVSVRQAFELEGVELPATTWVLEVGWNSLHA